MLTEAVLLALVAGVITILVELIRTRRKAATVAVETAKVVHEVTPNSGSSMKDAVNRIEKTVDDMAASVSAHGERLAAVEVLVGQRGRWRR